MKKLLLLLIFLVSALGVIAQPGWNWPENKAQAEEKNVLYTDYILLFQISGMILLVAMIGAIVLTYRERAGVKRQSYVKQISRERDEGVDLVEAEKNKGVKIDA